MNELFDTLWEGQDTIVVDHFLDITVRVRFLVIANILGALLLIFDVDCPHGD